MGRDWERREVHRGGAGERGERKEVRWRRQKDRQGGRKKMQGAGRGERATREKEGGLWGGELERERKKLRERKREINLCFTQ